VLHFYILLQNERVSLFLLGYELNCFWSFTLFASREHGVVGDMRDAWPNARVRKNVSLIRTYHGFKGITLLLLD
jgi:hypothetical protein